MKKAATENRKVTHRQRVIHSEITDDNRCDELTGDDGDGRDEGEC